MEVAVKFNFDSVSTTPYTTAPSSPSTPGLQPYQHHQLPRYYTSAPTSPSRAAAFYRHFRAVTMTPSSSSSSPSAVIPFNWEETPGTPKSPREEEEKQKLLVGAADDDAYSVDDFAFEFSGQLVHDGGALAYTATADELFEAGKIRPLKPPPRLYIAAGEYDALVPGSATAPSMSPKSPVSPTTAARNFFLPSPRRRRGGRPHGSGDDFVDPFEVALKEATRGRDCNTSAAAGAAKARPSRRPSRSLSPLRGLFDLGGEKSGDDSTNKTSIAAAVAATTDSTPTGNSGALPKGSSSSKKWRLRDLFLFRSASEGRATGNRSKDPLRRYTAASLLQADNHLDTARGSSFRSTVSRGAAGDGSVGGSSRRGSSRRSAGTGTGSMVVVPSPHEAHYAANRAVSEELRKKTFLPYRQGLLGCLGFKHFAGGAGIARGLSSTVPFRR